MSRKQKTKPENSNTSLNIFFNKILTTFLLLISYLPFSVIYLLSDLLYLILSKIIKYRRKVILENLHYAFPEKSNREIRIIMKKYYKHLSDLILETVKLHTISENELNKRLTIHGLDMMNSYSYKNKSIVVLAMHHNNWEWASFFQKMLNYKLLMLYSPVRGNKVFEKFLIHSRERWGGKCIPVDKSARVVFDINRNNSPSALWLGADQTAPANSKLWTIFLNREAPFFSGPEKIAVKTDAPIIFQNTKKRGRGRYDVYFSTLIEKPSAVEPNEIILAYVRKMEEIIKNEPEYYLWSHRRWKHKRPPDIPLTI